MSTLTTTAATNLSATVSAPRSGLAAGLRRALATENTWVPALARVALGLVILPHGLQKTVGAFGGYGFEGTMGFMTEAVGLPWLIALIVILTESVGALALIAGAASRLAAAGVAAVMVGAVVTTHAQHGFFMNWFGTQAGEGFEFHILALGLAAVVLVAGGGRASVDRLLSR